MPTSNLKVSVGILIKNNKVLVSRRPTHVHQGGLWEFPGGKQEINESSRESLQREFLEELGITIVSARPFIKLHYDYPEKPVTLDVWLIIDWKGSPSGKEGQVIEWVHQSDLEKLDFPSANKLIINAIKLPSLYLICPGPLGSREKFLQDIDECTDAGAKLVQLRCKEEIYKKDPDLINEVLQICEQNNTRLLLNSSAAIAMEFKMHGVHLNSARLLQLNERPLDGNYLVSASCHNQNELLQAMRLGVDFVVLSPVLKTQSHPDAAPLGWDRFSQLTEYTNIPVYALGGMEPGHLPVSWNYGAQGVAILSSIWGSEWPAEIIRKCFN